MGACDHAMDSGGHVLSGAGMSSLDVSELRLCVLMRRERGSDWMRRGLRDVGGGGLGKGLLLVQTGTGGDRGMQGRTRGRDFPDLPSHFQASRGPICRLSPKEGGRSRMRPLAASPGTEGASGPGPQLLPGADHGLSMCCAGSWPQTRPGHPGSEGTARNHFS